jgi:hypothetical protein
LHQLAVDVGREVGLVGVHRLGHAHRAALQQRHTRGRGGELCDGQFERHDRVPCLPEAEWHGCRTSPKSILLLMGKAAEGQSG